MVRSRIILVLIALLVLGYGCNSGNTTSHDHKSILSIAVKNAQNSNAALYHQTFDLVKVKLLLNEEVLNKSAFLQPVSSELDSIFSYVTMRKLYNSLAHYKSLSLHELGLSSVQLVTDEEIPDYIRFQYPNPTKEVDYYSVSYLSTPIVNNGKAILLSKYIGQGYTGIHFFIKDGDEWVALGTSYFY